jgi:O-methyltransferase
MPRRRKLDIEAIRAALNIECPHCHASVRPASRWTPGGVPCLLAHAGIVASVIGAIQPAPPIESSEAAELYLELMKKVLTRLIAPERYAKIPRSILRKNRLARVLMPAINAIRDPLGLALCRVKNSGDMRATGSDWPSEAETMVGMARLNNVHHCVRSVLEKNIPGDFIETGVWRGGVCIFMRAALQAYGQTGRIVWVADSFEGLPEPDPKYPVDRVSALHEFKDVLGVSLEQVKANFTKYGLLDDRVQFLRGWFKDSLPNAPIERLAILRLDGDLYSSTMDAITNLYPKVSPGGFVIVDDYGALEGCRRAIKDYRAAHDITAPIIPIDRDGVFWQTQE